ncbi:MAG TPA: N-acyl homoserine lactonase family protein [Solirubrobacteraceae bacterium]|jgi:N-acyl homoserine lactone hydrolase|nr:N-acyl homoserine lactonase family protein [Solirubrobacteraceae bacterium]
MISKLVAVNCGFLLADEGLLTRGEIRRQSRRIPVMSFLIESDAGVVVWDTGMCVAVAGDAVGYLGRIARRVMVPDVVEGFDVVSRLQKAGYSVDDVHLVINSHLHFDHGGMNSAFPPERVLLREREVAYGAQPDSGYIVSEYSATDAGSPRTFDYDGEYVLADGLTLIDTPGHTPGHQCLLVEFPSGRRVVLSGDLAYDAEQLEQERPPGICWDPVQAQRSIVRAKSYGAEILIGHDPQRWGSSDVQLVHSE